ncbi:MAG TPA: universal stress protein [Micropepsaceae bacterium]|nr:universal stress protein [Micropepsaceae bacterium]
MRRILVATDGSAGGDRAVDAAAAIVVQCDGELLIASVEQGYLHEGLESVRRDENASVDDYLNAACREILKQAEVRARAKGVSRIRTFSGLGDAVAFIIEIAERENADTVVVGKRGKGRLPGLLLGSVSQKLVSLAGCNVLVVP